jgi:hypothetical protein
LHRLYICSFFFSVYSLLPNSLFLLDKGSFICPPTSCPPCHPAFLPGFHGFGECACFSWLSFEILWLSESLSESVGFLSLRDMCCVLSVACICVCVCLCHGVHWQTNRDRKVNSESIPDSWLLNSDSLAPHTIIQTDMHTCVCVCVYICSFFECGLQLVLVCV